MLRKVDTGGKVDSSEYGTVTELVTSALVAPANLE